MVEAGESAEAALGAAQVRCRSCNKLVEKTYQDETCKPCLLKQFKKYIQMIDQFRDLKN